MEIKQKEITIKELVKGYQDKTKDEGGRIVGYGGKLDIRPAFQREFVYNKDQRDAVIDTVLKGYPLNVMYFAVKDNGHFEIIDGQQRTISICEYIQGDFSFKQAGGNPLAFHNQQNDIQKKIMDYKLTVYFCKGTPSEKLEWFKTINIAGEKLSTQELRNAVYSGSWVTDAKRYFGRRGCAAHEIAYKYMRGDYIRQDYLETVIDWFSQSKEFSGKKEISGKKDDRIERCMAFHQKQKDAHELWLYFQSIINWVKAIFPKYRKEMKGLPWGIFYNEYGKKKLDPKKLEAEISKLMIDDDVTSKSGIYPYVLTREERHLSLRAFSDGQKRQAFEKQKGICKHCKEKFELAQMEADHIRPWHEGGKTSNENCQMLCRSCNRKKAGK